MPLDSIDSQLTALAILENMINGDCDNVISLTSDLEPDDIIDGLFMLLTTMIEDAKTEMNLEDTSKAIAVLRNRVLQPAKV